MKLIDIVVSEMQRRKAERLQLANRMKRRKKSGPKYQTSLETEVLRYTAYGVLLYATACVLIIFVGILAAAIATLAGIAAFLLFT